ncbi:hypothetical protein COOONC_24640 [Cooperia oncophora]
MNYIFDESQALYPSIYLNNDTTPLRNFLYVQAIVSEAQRIAQNYSRPLPIYVFTKVEYNPLKELCFFYTAVGTLRSVVFVLYWDCLRSKL